ncbi:MAG: hypothetical protein IPK02_08425 [Candidatus Accumulibacter sp.]|uniref:Two component regulator propeller domain-containing protein n=1 Tax=Candidatus Accumulibacter affinis TaxID=2954384 RepID=A0A935W7K9_9PROT|nr:hypothetical protein [Candidatus Accumulibacter affinis]
MKADRSLVVSVVKSAVPFPSRDGRGVLLQRLVVRGFGNLPWLLMLGLALVSTVHADFPSRPDVENPLFEPRFESVGVGIIPRHVVPTMAQDRAGFLWIATGDGLDRFDPTSGSFSHHRHSSQTDSLPDDRVQALLVDREGTLWVGTWAGLSRRQVGSDHFEPVFSTPAPRGTIAAYGCAAPIWTPIARFSCPMCAACCNWTMVKSGLLPIREAWL